MLLGIATVTAREPLVVVAGALISGGTVLAARKGGTGPEAGRWELPGGKVGFGESERSALIREMQEELGVAVEVAERLGSDVDLGGGTILRAYRVHGDGNLTPTEHDQVRRLLTGELDTVDWLPADRELLPTLQTLLGRQAQAQS